MHRRLSLLLICGVVIAGVIRERQAAAGAALPPGLALGLHHLPVAFELNRGQAGSAYNFVAHAPGYTAAIGPTEIVLATKPPVPAIRPSNLLVDHGRSLLQLKRLSQLQQASPNVTMHLLGARHGKIVASSRLPGRVNYLLGSKPKAWLTNIPTYARITERGIYPGIDLVYYSTGGLLESDWIVHPGADPSAIKLRVAGVNRLLLDDRGDLVLVTGYGDLVEGWPRIYQIIAGHRHPVGGGYVLSGSGVVQFKLRRYDHARPLVIDPLLSTVFSDFLGGSGGDAATYMAVDGAGNSYVTGITNSNDFPTTAGALLTNRVGPLNSFVSKLNPSGDQLVYSTYIGGNAADFATNITVDSQGNAYVVGTTTSTNFPTVNAVQSMPTLAACPGNPFPGAPTQCPKVFVAELNPAGSALVFSTYLGGSGADYGNGLALTPNGAAVVTGQTASSSGFPLVNAFQSTYGGGADDGFIAMLSSSGGLLTSSYWGGTGNDAIVAVAIDPADPSKIYVAAQTNSPGFGAATAAAGQVSAVLARFAFSNVSRGVSSRNAHGGVLASPKLKLKAEDTLKFEAAVKMADPNPAVDDVTELLQRIQDPQTGTYYFIIGFDAQAKAGTGVPEIPHIGVVEQPTLSWKETLSVPVSIQPGDFASGSGAATLSQHGVSSVYITANLFKMDGSTSGFVFKFNFGNGNFVPDGMWAVIGSDALVVNVVARPMSNGDRQLYFDGSTGAFPRHIDLGTMTPIPKALRLHLENLNPRAAAVQSTYGGGPIDAFVLSVHEQGPPPAPTPTATPTQAPTNTPVPTNTPIPLFVSLKLGHSKVKVGAKESVSVTTLPGASVQITVAFPNGSKKKHSGTANSSGSLTWSYKQPAGKTTSKSATAKVTVTATNGTASAKASKKYKIG